MKWRKGLVVCFSTIGLAFVGSMASGDDPVVEVVAKKSDGVQAAPRPETGAIKAATVKWLDKDNPRGAALLRVDFALPVEPGRPATFRHGDHSYALRDDGQQGDEQAGDNHFSAMIPFDFDELRNALNNQGEDDATPVFDEAQIIARRAPATLKADQIKPGVEVDLLHLPVVTHDIDPKRSLFITDVKVVNDPSRTFDPCAKTGTPLGPWTFGHVMTVLANQAETHITPADFTRRWLARWERDQVINDFTVPARQSGIHDMIIKPWEDASGGPGQPLDLSKAPFRLLAIVNRVDLRDNLLFEPPPAARVAAPGGGGAPSTPLPPPVVVRDSNSGEGRLVFGALDLRTSPCTPLQFTVIFEFGINKANCEGQKDWAKQWYYLKNHPLGSPAYNAALQAITDQFIRPTPNPAKLPKGNGLNQLRTNEIALTFPPEPGPPLWEMREFRILRDDSDKGHLREVTVKQNPDLSLNRTTLLAQFINGNQPDLLTNRHSVPLFLPGPTQPFLGGSSPTPSPTFFWDGPAPSPSSAITNKEARFHFSLNTCNGCHAGETGTAFTMVKPGGPLGSEAGLAEFLTGITLKDPADNVTDRNFNDIQRRCQDLYRLVHYPCQYLAFMPSLRRTH